MWLNSLSKTDDKAARKRSISKSNNNRPLSSPRYGFQGSYKSPTRDNVLPFGLKIRSYFWAKSLGNVMKFAVHGLCLEVLAFFSF